MDFENGQVVLVDTNIIIEAHRMSCWNTLATFFSLETVEKCYEEAQTGYQNRSPEQNINGIALRQTLKQIVTVTEVEDANFMLNHSAASGLDPGERHLLIHAQTRADNWMLASPDFAAMKFMYNQGWLDRLVSLEKMIRQLSLSVRLRDNFTESWLSQKRTIMLLG